MAAQPQLWSPVVTNGQYVEKPWGHEEILAVVEGVYVLKTLTVTAGAALSLQWHREKDETIAVLSGLVEMELGPSADDLLTVSVRPGESVHVAPSVVHRVRAVTDAVLVEASSAPPGWRLDVVRLQDDYGRTGSREP